MTNIVKSWGAIVLLLGSIGCGGESSTSGASAKLGAPTLSTLSVSAGVLTPDFQPDVFAYTVDLRLLQDEVEINYASDAEGADITVNNGLGVNSLTSTEVTVGLDQEVVKEITVTNDKGQSSTYKVTLQRSNSELKAIASSGAASDFYGSAVAISGNRIVVGAKYDDDLGSLSGGAFVYTLENGVWGNEQKLYAYDGAAGDEFGASVAISGDVIVVGAPKEDEKANAAGAAYMFVYENGSWGTGKKIYASDGQTNEEFGSAVAISEDKIVIGSPYNS
ncbi:MAG: cadherin-like beta sandwich domain-containing protein, partial [Deltaproteobacteria bacterium]|nr:cadherin-like beta sandwich domain-containing protein [Deltaproteobacteria bacterium]